jgi:hypothetical protein
LSSSPYYYDPLQKSALIELGEKHFSKYEKEVFLKLKEQQVLNDNSLTIQERLAIERIKDFAKAIEIEFSGNLLKFWIWYLRDVTQTKNQIIEALNHRGDVQKRDNSNVIEQTREANNTNVKQDFSQRNRYLDTTSYSNNDTLRNFSHNQNNQVQFSRSENNKVNVEHSVDSRKNNSGSMNPFVDNEDKNNTNDEEEENSNEIAIENFFKENYLKVEAKQTKMKGIHYVATMKAVRLTVKFDCIFFTKKPTEADVISFYASSQKPKIVFVKNAAKKMLKLSEKLDNLEVVNI